MPRLTKEPWFGPKKYSGLGWSISSWQGGAATVIFIALIIGNSILFNQSILGIIGFLIIISTFILLVLLTGDTPNDSKF